MVDTAQCSPLIGCSAGLRCLYPRLAAANHSCVANSVYAWDEADNSIVLRATRWEVVFVKTQCAVELQVV